jgi:Anti-sigma-K factor rskA, C-terminal
VTGPDFRDVVGGDLPPDEEARLRHVHDLLLQAGPPPELPPALEEPPSAETQGELVGFPRRRALVGLLLAAALAVAAFGGGYLAGHSSGGKTFSSRITLPMHGTRAAPQATAALELGDAERSGNVPIRMVVQGLPTLPKEGYYELWLTRGNREVASCGTFRTHGRRTEVSLNAPYLIPRGEHPGWIVVVHTRGRETATPLLTT